MHLDPIDPDRTLSLSDRDARPPKGAPAGDRLEALIEDETGRIAHLQKVFYASGARSLLIILQGRDASGKDGTVRHVFRSVNPQGCQVTSFGPPSDLERKHDFLWRVHSRVPPHGMIGVFNRSHYEDVLVPRVHGDIGKHVWKARYREINDFERMLFENGTVILKFFLHISRGEQRTRLEARLADAKKNWKFSEGDLDDRARWAQYTTAYRDLLRHCSSRWGPWYLVPADDKKFRTWLIARKIADTMEGLDLRYPEASPAILDLEIP